MPNAVPACPGPLPPTLLERVEALLGALGRLRARSGFARRCLESVAANGSTTMTHNPPETAQNLP
eukprot:15477049-Alexandrium_andersonii.AAC.1